MPQMNGYIGRSPGDSAVTKARQVYNVTSSTSTFTFTSGYDVGYFEVFINGVKQVVNNDYTAGNGSTFTLTSAADNGDVIEAVAYKAFNLGTINNVTDDLSVGGDLTVGGVITGDGSGLTGVASTENVNTRTLVVAGVSTFNNGITTFTSDGVHVTGVVTATSFVGDVTGNADTASNLTGSPSITVTNITANGNVSIAGTLTYEDVTNVDSLGIVTANNGVRITAGGLNVVGVSTFASGISTVDGSGIQVTGVVTATSFDGDGSSLTNVNAATGGGTDKVFLENQAVVNTSYELSSGFNAMSVGPITVSAGTTVTVPANRRWVVL